MERSELKEIIDLQSDIGRGFHIPDNILLGDKSHAPKWHSCSIIEHIRWCVGLAEMLCDRYSISDDLIYAAAYHDIGKVTNPIFQEDGPIYHGHAEKGAEYIINNKLLPNNITDLIARHGAHHKEPYVQGENVLLIYLDLCDEFAKWSCSRFPPMGKEKQMLSRRRVIGFAVEAGVDDSLIYTLEEEADRIADEQCIIFDREIMRWD